MRLAENRVWTQNECEVYWNQFRGPSKFLFKKTYQITRHQGLLIQLLTTNYVKWPRMQLIKSTWFTPSLKNKHSTRPTFTGTALLVSAWLEQHSHLADHNEQSALVRLIIANMQKLHRQVQKKKLVPLYTNYAASCLYENLSLSNLMGLNF